VRALGPLLGQPTTDADKTAEFGAVGTKPSITQLLHTNEAAEDFSQALHARLLHNVHL